MRIYRYKSQGSTYLATFRKTASLLQQKYTANFDLLMLSVTACHRLHSTELDVGVRDGQSGISRVAVPRLESQKAIADNLPLVNSGCTKFTLLTFTLLSSPDVMRTGCPGTHSTAVIAPS
jgi:hypothetical protein